MRLLRAVTSRRRIFNRRYARQCLEIAPTFQDKEARAILLGLAQAWSEPVRDLWVPALAARLRHMYSRTPKSLRRNTPETGVR
jgi:hypothetical protein